MTLATLFLSAAVALLPQAATPPPVTAAPPAAQGELTADALGQIYYLYLKGRALDTRGDTPGALAAFRGALAPESRRQRACRLGDPTHSGNPTLEKLRKAD